MRTVLMLIAALAVTPALASMSLAEGQPYPEARAIILAEGWRPAAAPTDNRARDCGTREPCELYPETTACSGTGMGFCAFQFAKDGKTLNVVTRGEEPTLDHWSID